MSEREGNIVDGILLIRSLEIERLKTRVQELENQLRKTQPLLGKRVSIGATIVTGPDLDGDYEVKIKSGLQFTVGPDDFTLVI
jgi:hypothetical protein